MNRLIRKIIGYFRKSSQKKILDKKVPAGSISLELAKTIESIESKLSVKDGNLQLEETHEFRLNGQMVIITRLSRQLEKDEFKLHRNAFCGNFSCCIEFFEEGVEFSCINCPQKDRG